MGHMAVEPGGSPHWVGQYRGGNNFMNPYGRRNNNYYRDQQREKPIKEEVKTILLEKFNKIDDFTDEQKAKVKTTVEFQTDTFAELIIAHAEELALAEMEKSGEDYSDAVEESKDTKRQTEKFYIILREKAQQLAIKEYNISNTFDIDEAGKREEEIYEKLKNGEITKVEAQRLFEEPTMFTSRDKKRMQDIMRAFNQHSKDGREEAQQSRTSDYIK